jgi:hypothetical protein
MKYRLCVLFSILLLNAAAQEKSGSTQSPYFLDAPANWGIEHFLIPISFAPTIAYKGVEDIRFTPGWAKKESDEYWSYVFLWYLDGNIQLDAKTIEKNLSAYYTGLLHANLDTTKTKSVQIMPAKLAVTKISTEKDATVSFEATVNTLDFLTWQPIRLHLRIHVRRCSEENKTMIFHEVSSKSYNDAVWTRLHELWRSLRCKK